MNVYLLPGLACDRRLFQGFDLRGHEVHHLEWPRVELHHSLSDIAGMLLDRIDPTQEHVLVGVSMGGMVAQEMALRSTPQKVVLISSVTGPHEWPPLLHASRRLKLHYLINDFTMRSTWPLRQWLKKGDPEIAKVLFDMAVKQTAPQIRTCVDAILRWKGAAYKGPLVRIHGDRDTLLPMRFPVDHVVPGGTHVMTITRPREICSLVEKVIG
jgi:pimeloyl-ACP methyl ester carboxylesterase